VIPAGKSALAYLLLNLFLPGTGDLYLGPATRRQGAYQLFSFAMAFPLILAFGLGLLLLPILWLSAQVSTFGTLWRTWRARTRPDR
jgi:hypothetical protein